MYNNLNVKVFGLILVFIIAFQVEKDRFSTDGFKSNNIEIKSEYKLKIGVTSIPQNLDPRDAWHYLHFCYLRTYAQTLVQWIPSGRIASDLASSWEIKNDGTEYIFNLSSRVFFHDGTTVKIINIY